MRFSVIGLAVAALSVLEVAANPHPAPAAASAADFDADADAALPVQLLQPRVDPPSATCNTSLAKPPPQGYNCGKLGKITNPQLLNSAPASTLKQCVLRCKVDNDKRCISFGYNKQTKECRMYKRALEKQGYKDMTSHNQFRYYNRRCWVVNCPTLPGPCDNPVPPAGDFVVNGGFECGLKGWDLLIPSGGNTKAHATSPGFDDPDQLSFQVSGTSDNPSTNLLANLSQSLNFPATAETYILAFQAQFAGPSTNTRFIRINVGSRGQYLDKAILDDDDMAVDQWHRFEYRFNVPGGSQELSFSFVDGVRETFPTMYLDDVSVTVAPLDPCENLVPPAGDFVLNGGFECGLKGWSSGNIPSISTSVSPPGYDGPDQFSFQVNGTNPGASNFLARLNQPIDTPDTPQTYVVAFQLQFAAPTNVNEDDRSVEILVDSGNYFRKSITPGDAGAADQWHLFEYRFSATGNLKTLLFIYRHQNQDIDGIATTYLDDVSLKIAPFDPCENPVAPAGDLITNGGFECGLTAWTTDSKRDNVGFSTGPPGYDAANEMSFQFDEEGASSGSTNFNDATLSQPITSTKPVDYLLVFQIQFTNDVLSVRVVLADGIVGNIRPQDVGALSRWHRVEIRLEIDQPGSGDLVFDFRKEAAGSSLVYLDDISITESPNPCFTNQVRPAGDLVLNGEFDCRLNGWESADVGPSASHSVGGPGFADSKAYRVTDAGDDPANGVYNTLSQSINFPAAGTYSLIFQVTFTGQRPETGHNLNVVIGNGGQVLNGIILPTTLGGVAQYQRAEFRFSAPAGEQLLLFNLLRAEQELAYIFIDAVSVVAGPALCQAPIAPPSGDLVSNGGFDCGLTGWEMSIQAEDSDNVYGTTASPGATDRNGQSFQATVLQETAPGPNSPQLSLLQAFDVPADGIYTLSFNYKLTSADQILRVRILRFQVPGTVETIQDKQGTNLNQWQSAQFEIPLFVSTQLVFVFYGLSVDSPTIFVDDVSVVLKSGS